MGHHKHFKCRGCPRASWITPELVMCLVPVCEREGGIVARDFAKQFYSSKRWQRCRDSFMQSKHFICEHCGHWATVAHHKVHITPENINDPNITLNWDNLQALCADCHAKVHGNGTGVPDGYAFDAEGNLVKMNG